uniref:Uncharacterized protein n=1 Tax=Vitis vinifera TaxID=29760 RepID=F6GYF9_VITVI
MAWMQSHGNFSHLEAGALDNPRYKDVEGRRGSGEAGRPWIPDSGNFQCSDG